MYNLACETHKEKGDYFYNRALVKSRLDMVKEAIDDYSIALGAVTEPDHIY